MRACHRGDMENEGRLVQSIYYGNIGSETTERLLERFGHDGSFLLRDSVTVEGAYCLCVRKAPFVHTYRLIRSADGWCLQQDSTARLPIFRTLEALIDRYKRAAVVGIAPLTDPLDKTQVQNSLGEVSLISATEFLYMQMSNSSSSVY